MEGDIYLEVDREDSLMLDPEDKILRIEISPEVVKGKILPDRKKVPREEVFSELEHERKASVVRKRWVRGHLGSSGR